MNNFFLEQYDYIYFFYGLSFMFLFIVCFALEKGRSGKLPWMLLGLFGFVHGINEWMEIYIINTRESRIFSIIHLIILGISYLLLFEFARKGIRRNNRRGLGLWIYLIVFVLVFMGNKYGLNGMSATLRYFLGFPAGLLAALAIYKASRKESSHRNILVVLSVLMFFYAILTGLIVTKTDFLLASWMNTDSFYKFFGFPVQLLRGIIALLLAITLWWYSPALSDAEHRYEKFTIPFRPTKWTIIVSLSVLICLGWVFTNYLDYYAGIQIIKNTKANRDSPLNQLIRELAKLEQTTYILGKSPVIRAALNPINLDDVSEATALMNKLKDQSGAFDCLLLNKDGVIVISTDSSLPEGKMNKSYATLSYFKDAINGETGYYFIPGTTYNERVYYVSFPVNDRDGKIFGVVVLKKVISAKPIMKYRLLSIIITMFVCILTMIFFVVLRRRENMIKLIEDANNRLQTVDKMKTDFISIVSHELRTPLTSIKNAATIMLRADPSKHSLDQEEKDLMGIILANTNRQARMIDDLLDVSKIEAGVMAVNKESLDIISVAREVSNSLQLCAKEKGVKLNVSCSKESFILDCDPEHTRRIFTNLIVNAVNYTPENGLVTVDIVDNLIEALVTISDTGIGIREEDMPKLFNKFYRGGDAHTRQKGGSGLGLVITKGLVESQGGKIWVKSVFGKGSSFCFTIPIVKQAEMAKNGFVFQQGYSRR